MEAELKMKRYVKHYKYKELLLWKDLCIKPVSF